jgi:hypothetical protein
MNFMSSDADKTTGVWQGAWDIVARELTGWAELALGQRSAETGTDTGQQTGVWQGAWDIVSREISDWTKLALGQTSTEQRADASRRNARSECSQTNENLRSDPNSTDRSTEWTRYISSRSCTDTTGLSKKKNLR